MSRLFVVLLGLTGCAVDEVECLEVDMVEVFVDADRDGHGQAETGRLVCTVTRDFATVGDDCDDSRAAVHPEAIEICDGLDNDCDELLDDGLRAITYYADTDGDGYGNPSSTIEACSVPPGFVENQNDCDDANALNNPDGTEYCDGIDNNCNTRIDDQDPLLDEASTPLWYLDQDGDGFGDPDQFVQQCEAPPIGVANADDCDDTNFAIRPGAGETCDSIDNDCDGLIDDSDPDLSPAELTTWYHDFDGDGFGDPGDFVQTCVVPWFYVANADDCDDDEPLLGLPDAVRGQLHAAVPGLGARGPRRRL